MTRATLGRWMACAVLSMAAGCAGEASDGLVWGDGGRVPSNGTDASTPSQEDGGSQGIDATVAPGEDAGTPPVGTDAAVVGTDAQVVAPGCTPSAGTTPIGADVIRDNATCLMWEAHPGFLGRGNWEPANEYCRNLTAGGFGDWRMPTVEELTSLPITVIPWTGRTGTAPRYVPNGATDLGNFHYCGITHWDTSGPLACGWVGPGNSDGTICVRGEAAVPLTVPGSCDCQDGRAGYMVRND